MGHYLPDSVNAFKNIVFSVSRFIQPAVLNEMSGAGTVTDFCNLKAFSWCMYVLYVCMYGMYVRIYIYMYIVKLFSITMPTIGSLFTS